MKEILFFTYGDSRKASSWSNVPYLFAEALEQQNIIIRRKNIAPNRYIQKFFNITIEKLLKWKYSHHEYSWIRTSLFSFLTNIKIARFVKKYKHADYCFFLCFDYYNKFNNIPSLLFSDWTYSILIENRQNRKLYKFEQRFAKQQEFAINHAQCVISMFPQCTETMQKQYPNANIHFLGGNVINLLYKQKISPQKIIPQKIKSNIILFVGQKKYQKGANMLIDAFKILKQKNPSLTLHIIGMQNRDFEKLPSDVICHGYLHKDNETENTLYYNLMQNAKVIVNPSPQWAGFSSMVEAMFFYTPIVVSPYEDFKQTFGNNIQFGCYTTEFTPIHIAEKIQHVIFNDNYEQFCNSSHEAVKDFTWSEYSKRIINLLSFNNYPKV